MNIDGQKAVIDRLSKVLGYVELAKDSLQEGGYLSEMEVKISLDVVVKKVKEIIAIHEGHVAKWSTPPVKSAQRRRRDEIVEQAKRDVEYWEYEMPMRYRYNYVNFVVNKEKRTVVALLKVLAGSKAAKRGIAKCAPNDCFNSHIGKAIALRRALGLPVPDEYLNAPQPTEVRVGDIIRLSTGDIRTVSSITPSHMQYTTGKCNSLDILRNGWALIIDDSRE